MPDHVHILARIRPDRSVAEMTRTMKSASSKWVHQTSPESASFAWQTGYAAFSVSESQVGAIRRYIRNQAAHPCAPVVQGGAGLVAPEEPGRIRRAVFVGLSGKRLLPPLRGLGWFWARNPGSPLLRRSDPGLHSFAPSGGSSDVACGTSLICTVGVFRNRPDGPREWSPGSRP